MHELLAILQLTHLLIYPRLNQFRRSIHLYIYSIYTAELAEDTAPLAYAYRGAVL